MESSHSKAIEFLKSFFEKKGHFCLYNDNKRVFSDLLFFKDGVVTWIEVDNVSSMKEFDIRLLMRLIGGKYLRFSSKNVLNSVLKSDKLPFLSVTDKEIKTIYDSLRLESSVVVIERNKPESGLVDKKNRFVRVKDSIDYCKKVKVSCFYANENGECSREKCILQSTFKKYLVANELSWKKVLNFHNFNLKGIRNGHIADMLTLREC